MSNLVSGTWSLRKNDQVQVISGREKGKIGKVLNVSAKTGRVTIEKVNLIKRHTRPNAQNTSGGIVEREASIHFSNVLLMCNKCEKGVRHGHKFVDSAKKMDASGKSAQVKVRICKRCGEQLDQA